jgi:hypothetical protein
LPDDHRVSANSILPADFTESTFAKKLVKTAGVMRRSEITIMLIAFAAFAVVLLAVGLARSRTASPESIQALVSNRDIGACVRSELRTVQALPEKNHEPLTAREVDAAKATCERRLPLVEVLDAQDRALSWKPTPK